MMAAVEQDVSLALVTGRSGTGKTLLSQMILRNLDAKRYQPALVLVSPGMGKTALLREILSEAGVELPERQCFMNTLLGLLSDYIIDLYRHDRKLVILIDECHFLGPESLHTLRTLSNIEVPEKKLLTCILFSEPRLLNRLQHPNYEALRGRMYMQAQLEPIGSRDIRQYVKFRLLLAGGREDLFDESGLTAVQMCSGGICRLINKVCSCAMLEAAVQQAHTISAQHVGLGTKQCMEELKSGLRDDSASPESSTP
jgi:general secretion pathway protein A